ncbi:MAG: beta-lactamase family protein [Ignavibacteriaceae bacterium]|nr:beta-lactamase family protein [Ignavibacteriaceae bacterium]
MNKRLKKSGSTVQRLRKTIPGFLILLGLICFSPGCSDQNTDKTERLFSDYDNSASPGAAVMIIKGDHMVFRKCFGSADIEKKEEVSAATNFRLASLSKSFTAFSILILINKGLLRFETTLGEIFPDFPDYGRNITIKHLLQHTSGLPDYESLTSDDPAIILNDQEVLKLLTKKNKTLFPPGSRFRYSNSGYAVLSVVIEKVSGKPYPLFLKECIFDPLEMRNSVAYINGINMVNHRAYGYKVILGMTEKADQNAVSGVLGDGGIYSSLKDMLKWEWSLRRNILISDSLRSLIWQKGRTSKGTEFNYGLGWRIENYKGYYAPYHPGSSTGFRNIYYRIPSEDFALIILTNRESDDPDKMLNLAHRIVDIWLNK